MSRIGRTAGTFDLFTGSATGIRARDSRGSKKATRAKGVRASTVQPETAARSFNTQATRKPSSLQFHRPGYLSL
eukprot:10607510-Alexandrium_andersonii.AAC.1